MTERPLLTPPTPRARPGSSPGTGGCARRRVLLDARAGQPRGARPSPRRERAHREAYMQRHEVDVRGLYDELLGRIQETDRSVETRMGETTSTTAARRRGSPTPSSADARPSTRTRRSRCCWIPTPGLRSTPSWASATSRCQPAGAGSPTPSTALGSGNTTSSSRISSERRPSRSTFPRVTSVIWAADDVTLLLTQEDEQTKRAHRLLALRRGEQRPHLLREEPDERFNLGVHAHPRSALLAALRRESHDLRGPRDPIRPPSRGLVGGAATARQHRI